MVAYHINLLEEYGHIHPIFYVSFFHPHVGPVPTHPPSPFPLDDNAAGEFDVKDILNSHLCCSGIEDLVKWLGYPILEAMWELVEYLANTPDIRY